MKKHLIRTTVLLIILPGLLAGCSAIGFEGRMPNPPGMEGGMGRGIMQRHHAQIPDEYAGLRNPIPADQKSLTTCNFCLLFTARAADGEDGMGDGPAGQTLGPAPAVIAHTSQMMGDDYLFCE